MRIWKAALAAASLAGALAAAGVARADVKAGVDAWSAGDYARAVAEWREPAARDDPDALFNLAQAYRLGRGVPADPKEAEALYARAAAKGHLKAADNYGVLLFQDGRRAQALPYVAAAAERGDPRAQYLLGIAHFNGDLVAKDWTKAYALLTLANTAGLPQAGPAIAQMDGFIPLPQRQQAQILAGELRARADARRSSEMAAADLSDGVTAIHADGRANVLAAAGTTVQPVVTVPPGPARQAAVAPAIAAAEAAVAEAMRATGTESPAEAGADYARPASRGRPPAAAEPVRTVRAHRGEPSAAGTGPGGSWRVQLGAFAVPGNAERAWAQAARTPVLAGKTKQTVPAGRLTRLLAAGWPSRAAAQSACDALKTDGQSCIVIR